MIVVPAAQLFAPDSATLLRDGAALLQPIAIALGHTPGRLQMTGHTDGAGVRSARYPSDWDLSVDRARTVRDALRELGIAGPRMSFDGRAGIEPPAAPTARARRRRRPCRDRVARGALMLKSWTLATLGLAALAVLVWFAGPLLLCWEARLRWRRRRHASR